MSTSSIPRSRVLLGRTWTARFIPDDDGIHPLGDKDEMVVTDEERRANIKRVEDALFARWGNKPPTRPRP